MNDMLVKNTEIESEDTQEPKTYDLRPLVASDMGMICKIITAIGVRQFKECFNIEQTEDVKEDIKKVSFNKEVDKTFSIINNDIDTTDFLLTNGVNEKDIIELMKHKGMMPEDIEVTYDKDSKAILKLK